jgi:Putative beta-barrel porin-2, OmpL-like. bbp2
MIGPAQAEPVATPAFIGPLSPNPAPASFDAGPFGRAYVTGQLTGLGLVQSNAVPAPGTGNAGSLADISNAQIEVQTTGTVLQLYAQAGAYSLPTLGTPYVRAQETGRELFGVLPVAYATLNLAPQLSLQAGSLMSLIGVEYTFTFQHMNIERGLLWAQEPIISKGVQLNLKQGPVTASLSFNDGFYSDHYNWLSGLVSYAVDEANTIGLAGGGNFSRTATAPFAAALPQNNSSIYNVIYTCKAGRITLNPYLQYTHVNEDTAIGIDRSAHTWGAAFLGAYSFTKEFALSARVEYIKAHSAGCDTGATCTPTNLLYGPDSSAWSLTFTPSYQKAIFFVRGEVSYVRIDELTPGFGFGASRDRRDQVRGLIEAGVLF